MLYANDSALANKGVSRDLIPTQKQNTGPTWYTKPVAVVPFSQGKQHQVVNEDGALLNAIKQAMVMY